MTDWLSAAGYFAVLVGWPVGLLVLTYREWNRQYPRSASALDDKL